MFYKIAEGPVFVSCHLPLLFVNADLQNPVRRKKTTIVLRLERVTACRKMSLNELSE